jgi:hypothetical protein
LKFSSVISLRPFSPNLGISECGGFGPGLALKGAVFPLQTIHEAKDANPSLNTRMNEGFTGFSPFVWTAKNIILG